MSSGPSLPSNPSPAYQYQNMSGADSGAYSGANNLTNYPAQNYGQFENATNNITSGSYGAPQIQGAANTAITAGNSLVPYATQTLNTAYDPQNANYNNQFATQQQQSNVNNAANGVSGTPYAAGVTNAGDNAFNLAWQQQQLANQQTGANTASTLLGQQANNATTGANLLTGTANENLSALGALNTAGLQGTGVQNMTVQDLLSYLSGGTAASNAATGQYSAESSAALGQQNVNNQGLAGLGNLGGNLLGMFL